MDYLEKGKKLAQDGNYEEALENLFLALENDKENPDIHFFIGLCYSSMEDFTYAKYYYQIALSLDPEHQKTKLMWDSIKHVEAEKPPERRLTRAATAKARRKQEQESETESAEEKSPQVESERETVDESGGESGGKYKITDEKWEKAFPMEKYETTEEKSNFFVNFLIFLIIFALIGGVVFFILQLLGVI